MASFTPGSSSDPSAEVELTISCRNLRDMDVFSKSDPMCVVYLKDPDVGIWKEIKRTEIIYNNLDPDFATKVQLIYHFEEQQFLKFDVYDIDTQEGRVLGDQDFLGSSTTTLGQIVSNRKVVLPLEGNKVYGGEILISAEEMLACRDEVTMKFSAKDLDRKDWFGWSDPFLEVYKIDEANEPVLVHRTEVVKWTLAPEWKSFTLPIRSLCGGDYDRRIEMVCLDWNRSGSHSLIGQFHVTLRQLSSGPGEGNIYECIHPKKQKKASYKNSGYVILDEFSITKVYSFLDFILGGMQIHCTVAIDFTASNGDPNSPQSLHFMNSVTPNQYEQALSAVVEIIEDYDSDRLFPVLGFGARLPPQGQVSHEFFVNLHPDNPYCEGVQGVLQSYKRCLKQIQLYGPTNFSPVINHVAKFAQVYQDGSQYFILLIITDGVITDMPQTKQAIVYASTLPMSIIIVGVGNADFTAMNELDADTRPLQYGSVKAARDIVQFVPFKNFQRVSNVAKAKAYLAKEVLAEIPDQVVGFMKSKGISPRSPFTSSDMLDREPPPYCES